MSHLTTYFRLGASISLIALIFLCLLWEGLLAPLNTSGSLLILKALPLLMPLFGILKGKRYTYQWSSMLILLYLTEGIVRAWSDQGLSASLAMVEIMLSVVFFICTIFYARYTRKAAL
ncbi:MAG: DUF2069 domain-containing protein [Methylophilaceae bacterium]